MTRGKRETRSWRNRPNKASVTEVIHFGPTPVIQFLLHLLHTAFTTLSSLNQNTGNHTTS